MTILRRIREDYPAAPPPTAQCCGMPKRDIKYMNEKYLGTSSAIGRRARYLKSKILGWNPLGCQAYAKWEIGGMYFCDRHIPKDDE